MLINKMCPPLRYPGSAPAHVEHRTCQMEEVELVCLTLSLNLKEFLVCLMNKKEEICILQVHFCHPMPFFHCISEHVEPFHLEVLVIYEPVQMEPLDIHVLLVVPHHHFLE